MLSLDQIKITRRDHEVLMLEVLMLFGAGLQQQRNRGGAEHQPTRGQTATPHICSCAKRSR